MALGDEFIGELRDVLAVAWTGAPYQPGNQKSVDVIIDALSDRPDLLIALAIESGALEPCTIDCSEHYDGRHLSATHRLPQNAAPAEEAES